jgi:hypothetical protein
MSAGTGIVQPFVLFESLPYIWMYGKVCLSASVVVAYTNDGYLRDAYRWLTGESQGLMEA